VAEQDVVQDVTQHRIEATLSNAQPEAAPAAAENTEAPAEHMIPKTRFDEVNKKLRELEAAQAKAAKEREEAERVRLVEQQKYQELYESERKRAADMESQVEQMREAQRRATVQASIRQAAQAAGFADPADAVQFIAEDALQVDEDGAVTNAQQLIDALAQSKPYLLAATKAAPGIQPGPKPTGRAEAHSDEEIRLFAARFGVRPEYVKQVLRS